MVIKKLYEYDVFISYSHTDELWANVLYDSLSARGFNVFLDDQRLVVGRRWEPQLLNALSNSRHLIVLWSDAARQSDWVMRELYNFDARRHAFMSDEDNTQNLILVVLEGHNRALSDFQAVTDIRDANLYGTDVHMVPNDLWIKIVDRLDDAIRLTDNYTNIPTVVFAMTKQEFDIIKPNEKPNDFSPSLAELINFMGNSDNLSLASFYGLKRTDWLPFGGDKTVYTLLNDIIHEMNSLTHKPQFRWHEISDEFWSNDYELARQSMQELLVGPAFVLIDPISLYSGSIRDRLPLLQMCYENPYALIISLPPFEMPSSYIHLRIVMKHLAIQLFSRFYEPTLSSIEEAYCNLGISDLIDVRRAMIRILSTHVQKHSVTSTPNFLRF